MNTATNCSPVISEPQKPAFKTIRADSAVPSLAAEKANHVLGKVFGVALHHWYPSVVPGDKLTPLRADWTLQGSSSRHTSSIVKM